jgi:hypothetical protein
MLGAVVAHEKFALRFIVYISDRVRQSGTRDLLVLLCKVAENLNHLFHWKNSSLGYFFCKESCSHGGETEVS